MTNKAIRFTGEFSLTSAVAVILYVYFVWNGSLPWWSVGLAWLYNADFLKVNLRKIPEWIKTKKGKENE
ncbi:hypothetical protein [Vibrio lentus]|uniref:hypothetical protein n=1 Tax=Vibrio lentus TaxID=136468 RepID=UPI000C818458|nr:hypothetical protein [Vibrio lentus]PML25106.1 hypothetical protein BCT80_20290 [Vibrio lentus]